MTSFSAVNFLPSRRHQGRHDDQLAGAGLARRRSSADWPASIVGGSERDGSGRGYLRGQGRT